MVCVNLTRVNTIRKCKSSIRNVEWAFLFTCGASQQVNKSFSSAKLQEFSIVFLLQN